VVAIFRNGGLSPFTQRRKCHRKHVWSVIGIRPDLPFLNQAPQVLVLGRNDPHVDLKCMPAPQTLDRAGPRKLRAYLQREVPKVQWPAASSIGDLLRREGLAELERNANENKPGGRN